MKFVIQIALRWLIAPIAILLIIVFAALAFIRYPDPVTAFGISNSVPSELPEIMESKPIAASANPYLWPVAAISEKIPRSINHEGVDVLTDQILQETGTNAFVIARGGVITYEWYGADFQPEQLVNTMSIGKTVVGMLTGQLISEGSLQESDSITKYLTQYSDVDQLDKVTIKHLLDMQSCIGIAEEYPEGPAGWFSPIAQLFATTDIEYVLGNSLSVVCAPGSEEYEYRSVNTQLLGMIISEIKQQPLNEIVSQQIWTPIGAGTEASWSGDANGVAKSYCCFNASARDLALLGSVFLTNGEVPYGNNQGAEILGDSWYSRMTTPAEVWSGGFGAEAFGANMWHKPREQLVTQGYRGQFVWINRYTDTVIVKLSDNIDGVLYEETVSMLDQISFGQ